MHALPPLTLLRIVDAVGHNLSENVKQALHQSLHPCADQMEKLSLQFQSVALSKDLAANQAVYMPPQLSQQLLV
jgi:hypothetical protein